MAGLTEGAVQTLSAALQRDGWCCLPRFLDAATVAALHADLECLRPQFTAAAVGRAQQHQRQPAIRSDETLWLHGASAAQRDFLATLEQLRLALNRHLYLGLFDYEAHYAYYAPGAFYRRHFDAFNSGATTGGSASAAPRRILSTVCYLNTDWQRESGGELVLWDRGDREVARIVPSAGTAVFFLSDAIPHEVLPASAPRCSIAGWFRSQGSYL